MKRVFILKGLDCPNCSAKIEKEVGELDGVTSSTVNLMNQTMTVQAGTSVATSLLDTVTTIVHSHEPDVEVSEKTEPAVTKVYLLKGLDCPNCSAKIEREVGELDGVTSSTVNLMNQTLTVQAGTSVAASLLDTVTTIVHSYEPDVEVSEKQLEATAPVKKDEKAAVYNDEDMLTGDDERIGKSVADELGLDAYYAQLLPDQKVEKLEMLDKQKRQGSKLAFVGDGINDAPVLARADVGIAMGGLGSDAAIEAADVVLMTDEPSKLVEAIDVAKATKRIVMQNIVIALGIKSVFLVLGALGMAGMWEAVFGDVGVTIIAVLNAMRILKK